MAKKMNDENNVDKALLEHIKQEEFKNKPQLEEESNILYDKDSDLSNDRTTDLQFMSFDVKQLPCGIFYPDGTKLRVRAAQVREIHLDHYQDFDIYYLHLQFALIHYMKWCLSFLQSREYNHGFQRNAFLNLREQKLFPKLIEPQNSL